MIKRGELKSFNSTTYTASVQMSGSLAVWLDGIAVARNIASAEMVPGRRCAVLFFSDTDPKDSVLVAVYV